MKLSKKNILILLILSCGIIAGLYIFGVQKQFKYITPLYMALSVILAFVFFVHYYQNTRMGYNISLENREFSQEEKNLFEARRTKQKIALIFLIPIILSVLGDYIYIVFFSGI